MAPPLVSIVIPTHNRCGLVQRALRSALGQTYPAVEVVVVDDGSEDETPQVIRRWQEQHDHLRYIRNEEALGACAARNRGIREARGEFVALLDDDDEFTPQRIERLMRCYRDEPDWSFVCSDYLSIRRNGTRRSRKRGRLTLEKMLWTNYASPSALTRRRHLLAIGGYDESLAAAQDYDTWTRLIERFGDAYRLGEVLYLYHQEHDAPRISSTPKKTLHGYFDYYRKHRHRMTRGQRAWQLYQLMKRRGRRITLCHLIRMVPLRFYPRELNDLLIEHTNVYQWLTRLRKRLRRKRA